MSELGSEEQAWLEVLRKSDEPTDADRARVRAMVLAGVAGAGAGVAASTTVGKVGVLGVVWKIGLATLSLGVLVGGGVWLQSRSTPATVVPTAVETQPAAEAAAPLEVAAPAERVPDAPSLAPQASSGVAPPPRAKQPADDIEAELALLSRAQRALASHDSSAALQLLGQHRARFPHGSLQVEREGLFAVAACEAQRADGTKLATRFLQTHPGSPLSARVRAACLSR